MDTPILPFRAGPKVSKLLKKEQLLIRIFFFPQEKCFLKLRIRFSLPLWDLSVPGKLEALQAQLAAGKQHGKQPNCMKQIFYFSPLSLPSSPQYTSYHLLGSDGVVDDEGGILNLTICPETKTPQQNSSA